MLLTTIYSLEKILITSVLGDCPEMNVHFPSIKNIPSDLKSQDASFSPPCAFCLLDSLNLIYPCQTAFKTVADTVGGMAEGNSLTLSVN